MPEFPRLHPLIFILVDTFIHLNTSNSQIWVESIHCVGLRQDNY
jgi:hypothetical protein